MTSLRRAPMEDFSNYLAIFSSGFLVAPESAVIAPNADVKIFVVASPEARTRRRFLELNERGEGVSESEILADILKRTRANVHHTADEILLPLYGIGEERPLTLHELAARLGISRERVRQLKYIAIKRMRDAPSVRERWGKA